MTSTGNIFVCLLLLFVVLFVYLSGRLGNDINQHREDDDDVIKDVDDGIKDVDDDNDDVNLSHHLGNDVDGDGEDDCTVVLRGDAVQGLEVPQLEKEKS